MDQVIRIGPCGDVVIGDEGTPTDFTKSPQQLQRIRDLRWLRSFFGHVADLLDQGKPVDIDFEQWKNASLLAGGMCWWLANDQVRV
jgi:hypothetical protein